MKSLHIIGAGGFGSEVLQYAMDIEEAGLSDWKIAGFLDDDLDSLAGYSCGYKVLGTVKDHAICGDNVYICAIGDPRMKLAICRGFLGGGANFTNIVHPKAYVGRNCKMGVGVVLCPSSSVTADATLGNFVTVNLYSSCGHDSIINDGCTLSPSCDVTGFAQLGEGVFMGSHAVVCPGVKIEDYARVGAGAVVIRDVLRATTVVGVPAREVRR